MPARNARSKSGKVNVGKASHVQAARARQAVMVESGACMSVKRTILMPCLLQVVDSPPALAVLAELPTPSNVDVPMPHVPMPELLMKELRSRRRFRCSASFASAWFAFPAGGASDGTRLSRLVLPCLSTGSGMALYAAVMPHARRTAPRSLQLETCICISYIVILHISPTLMTGTIS